MKALKIPPPNHHQKPNTTKNYAYIFFQTHDNL